MTANVNMLIRMPLILEFRFVQIDWYTPHPNPRAAREELEDVLNLRSSFKCPISRLRL
jgi:hypothetical protein